MAVESASSRKKRLFFARQYLIFKKDEKLRIPTSRTCAPPKILSDRRSNRLFVRMIARCLARHLLRHANYYPIMTLTGPRQSGKTALARASHPHHRRGSVLPCLISVLIASFRLLPNNQSPLRFFNSLVTDNEQVTFFNPTDPINPHYESRHTQSCKN